MLKETDAKKRKEAFAVLSLVIIIFILSLIYFKETLLFDVALKLIYTVPILHFVFRLNDKYDFNITFVYKILIIVYTLVIWLELILNVKLYLLIGHIIAIICAVYAIYHYVAYNKKDMRGGGDSAALIVADAILFLTLSLPSHYSLLDENGAILKFMLISLIAAVPITAVWVIIYKKTGFIYLKKWEEYAVPILVLLISSLVFTFFIKDLNFVFDFSNPHLEQAYIIEKEIASGDVDRFYFVLNIDGNEKKIDVSPSVYNEYSEGESISLDVYGGAFDVTYCVIRQ